MFIGKHAEVFDTELYGILQATDNARRWSARDREANTIWIFVDNQAPEDETPATQQEVGEEVDTEVEMEVEPTPEGAEE